MTIVTTLTAPKRYRVFSSSAAKIVGSRRTWLFVRRKLMKVWIMGKESGVDIPSTRCQ